MAKLTEKQATALQSQYNFWSKQEYEAMLAEDTEKVETASKRKEDILAKATEGEVSLNEWEPPTETVEATPAKKNSGKDTTPKSVKESAAVAAKAKKLAADKAAGVTPGKVKVVRAKKEKVLQPCLDGCGEQVPGNFKMGHDAKLKSMILKIERGEMAPTDLPEIAQELVGFKKGDVETEKDKDGKVKSKTQLMIVTKAPVKFHGRPEITLTTRD